MAERSSSSVTSATTKRERCPAGTKSCTDGGSRRAWSRLQSRKVLLMQVLNLTRLPRASKIRYFPDRLLVGSGDAKQGSFLLPSVVNTRTIFLWLITLAGCVLLRNGGLLRSIQRGACSSIDALHEYV